MLTVSEGIAEDGPGVARPVFVIDTPATGPPSPWLYCYIDILHTVREANRIHMLLLFARGLLSPWVNTGHCTYSARYLFVHY